MTEPNRSQDVKPFPTDPVDKDVGQVEQATTPSKEVGGPKGPEPTRYGDWERKGRCIDF